MLRTRLSLAAVVGLGLSQAVSAQEPPRLGVEASRPVAERPGLSANQQVANTIADHLRQSGQLRHYSIDVVVQDGTAEVSGNVADQQQREEALRLVQGVPGVERVLDRLSVAGSPVRQTQAVAPGAPEPGPLPRKAASDAPVGGPVEPMPIGGGGAAGPYDVAPPRMPPYAWPTYAPYNNFSRVAYPQLYPYNAWPYIGPQYPFPKIPLSWRKVSLEWQDGHWWYGPRSTSHDWWRLRYW
jgi:BON domain-containing protein